MTAWSPKSPPTVTRSGDTSLSCQALRSGLSVTAVGQARPKQSPVLPPGTADDCPSFHHQRRGEEFSVQGNNRPRGSWVKKQQKSGKFRERAFSQPTSSAPSKHGAGQDQPPHRGLGGRSPEKLKPGHALGARCQARCGVGVHLFQSAGPCECQSQAGAGMRVPALWLPRLLTAQQAHLGWGVQRDTEWAPGRGHSCPGEQAFA